MKARGRALIKWEAAISLDTEYKMRIASLSERAWPITSGLARGAFAAAAITHTP